MVAGAQPLQAAASRSSLVRSVRRRGDEREDERRKKESESEGFLAKRRDDIYRPRRVTVADLPWPRSRWRFPQETEMAPHDLARGYNFLRSPQKIQLPRYSCCPGQMST